MKKISLFVFSVVLAIAGVIALLTAPRAITQAAPGAVCNWTGPQDAAPYPWSSVAYWDCGKVPGPGDTAIIDGGFRVVSIDAPVTVHNLVLVDGGSGSGIHGYHTLTVTGQMDWDGAIVGGAHLSPTGAAETVVIAPGAVMSLTRPGGDNRLLQGRIVNYGTIEHTDGKWLRNYYGVIDNRPGGVYRVGGGRIEQNNIYASPDDSGWFENAGAIIKEGDDTFTLHIALINSGQVSVTDGALMVHLTSSAQVVTHTGAFAVAAPGILELGSYEHRFGPSSAISGDGILRMSNGAHAVVDGAYSLTGLIDLIGGANLYLDTATGAVSLPVIQMGGSTRLGGSNAITVTEIMTLSNSLVEGTSSNTNTLNIAPGATLLINQSGGLSSRTLNNYGSIVQEAGQYLWMINDAVFNNRPTGVYTVSSGGMGWGVPWSVIGKQFNNQGRMVKEGIGEFGIWGTIAVSNSGTLDVVGGTLLIDGDFVQSAGETRLRNGSVLGRGGGSAGDLIFNGGALRGLGALNFWHNLDVVQNNGAVVDPIGRLAINNGGYRQGASGVLQIDIGGLTPETEHDALDVGGNAALDGRLILSPTNGFRPAAGDVFNVMTYGSRSGEFATVDHGLGLAFGPEYQSDKVAISDNPTLIEVVQRPDLVAAPPVARNGFAVRMFNPDPDRPVTVTTRAILPEGAEYLPGSVTPPMWGEPALTIFGNAQSLRWGAIALAPQGVITLHWQATMPAQVGLYTNTVAVTVTQSPTVTRRLVTLSTVAAATPPVSDTEIYASIGILYPPAAPGQPWKFGLPKTRQSNPTIVITTTPVCAFPACGPLVRMTALHDGVFYTMTEISPGSQRFSVTIPAEVYSIYEPVFLVPFWEDPAASAHVPQSPDFICRMLGLGDIGPDGLIHTDGRCPPPATIDRPGLFDPSGHVTNARTGAPIRDATVMLYRVPSALPDTRTTTRGCRTIDTRPDGITGTWDLLPPATPNLGVFEEPGFSPVTIDPPINPQRTDDTGHYGWDVIRGCWYIKVEAPGYLTKYSAVVGVPPEVTDLDIALEPWHRVYLPVVIR